MRTPGTLLALAVLGASGLAGCGGSTHSTVPSAAGIRPASAGPIDSGSAPSGGVPSAGALLDAVPFTSAGEEDITWDDYAALWRSAGLPAVPSGSQLRSTAGRDASDQALGAGPFGPPAAEAGAAPIPGFDPLAVTAALQVGSGLSYLRVPVDTEVTDAAFARVPGVRVARLTGGDLFDLTRSNPYTSTVAWIRAQFQPGYADIPASGDAFVFSARTGSQTALDLGAGAPLAQSLGAQPTVRRLLSLWPGAESINLGTRIATGLPGRLSAAGQAQLLKASGLDRVPGPITFAGYAYVGGPVTAPTYDVATVYGSQAAAAMAVETLGAYLRDGVSVSADLPYSRLLTVEHLSAHAGMVVARVRLHGAVAMSDLVDDEDFPLLWTAR